MIEIIITIIMTFVLSLYWAFVESILYNWFVFPLTGIELTFWQIYGLGLFWITWNYKYIENYIEDDDEKMGRVFKALLLINLVPALCLLIGYFVKDLI